MPEQRPCQIPVILVVEDEAILRMLAVEALTDAGFHVIEALDADEALEHHAVRASHAKSSACAVGELRVADDLPAELAQGLFAQAGSYPVAVLREHDAVFELRAQLWTEASTQPIEDASVEWPASDSPYRTVATLTLPRQEAYGPGRVRYFDEVVTFRRAHSLVAHRPLGSVMRARLQVYRALGEFRHRENGVAAADTASVADTPA